MTIEIEAGASQIQCSMKKLEPYSFLMARIAQTTAADTFGKRKGRVKQWSRSH
jgi:hypothetical protein